MATTRTANAHWEGPLIGGAGSVSLDSSNVGTFEVNWPPGYAKCAIGSPRWRSKTALEPFSSSNAELADSIGSDEAGSLLVELGYERDLDW